MSVSRKGCNNPFWGKHHSEETKNKIGLANKGKTPRLGKHLNEEAKRKIGLASKGRYPNQATRVKMSLARKGIKLSSEHIDKIKAGWTPEVRKRMSQIRKGRKFSLEHKNKIGEANKSRIWKKESRDKLRIRHLGSHLSDKAKLKISIANKQKRYSQEVKDKISKAAKLRYQDTNFLNKHTKATMAAMRIRPNKPEIVLMNLLNKLYPNEWKYTGDGSIIIAGLNPDFTNVNGKKLLIELYGEYWHSVKLSHREWKRTELGRMMVYNSFGYNSLIVWQKELQDIPKLVMKLDIFCGKV